MTEAVQPIDTGRVWKEKEAPPNCLGIGCSEGVSAKKPPVRRSILDLFWVFFCLFSGIASGLYPQVGVFSSG